MKNNPKLVKEIEKNKKEKQEKNYNLMGSVVSFFLQEYEVRVLEVIFKYCCEKKYIKDNICVLCADGIMLMADNIKEADIAVEFNAIVKETMGFDLQFDEKLMNEDYLEILDNHIISSKSLDETKLETFDTKYFSELKSYVHKKHYFEHFVCKVLRPDPAYIYIESRNGVEELCFYSQGKITETFNHLKSGERYDNGEEEKFMTRWLNDESIKCFNKMDFLPFNERTPLPDDIFNLFRGFNENVTHEYDISKSTKILKPFMDLGIQLCGGNQAHLDYLLKYLADIIQHPERKNPIAFIIKGKQGTGKNVFLAAIGNTLGKHHYITSSNPKDFFGDYAEGFYHKLLVNMNECEGKDTFDFEGRIKSFITEDTITLNRKFVQPITIANLARLIIFSNKPNPIPIDVRSKDRRYVVYETTEHYLQSQYGTLFWKQLVAHFNKPEFIACLYNYLNTLDLTKIDWRAERPITAAYLQMCKLYVPTEALFLEHKLVKALEVDKLCASADETRMNHSFEKQWREEGISGTELFKDYTSFCKEFGFYKENGGYQKNIKSFYGKLAELELPMIQKKPNNLTTFSFTIKDVLQEMKTRQ